MDRKDIAEFAGVSLAAVSREFRDLVVRRVIRLRDRRHVKIAGCMTPSQPHAKPPAHFTFSAGPCRKPRRLRPHP